ncbi:menaquinone biosynthetic enzyme MqnA/MqnD family protein [Granulicella arctica]|uniref:Chorismate dehydratase n=1 Tax=Granulicella arctica TaxID=940613 RepID=A0A7Y9TML9_9BACT|nr:chorismate dehydratase [Granulicella arctica]
MSAQSSSLRVAAIDFLNPAPLMWDFEHPPHSTQLAERYQLHYTQPSQCAAELLAGRADLGLIPIAALTPELAIVPGCTIASLDRVRSIQLIIKAPHTLDSVKTIAADNASRSSLAYTQVLFRKFIGTQPEFVSANADPMAMLQHADAALLIGDPALLALEAREQIEQTIGPCLWFDIAHEWHTRTGLPWVAAVWATRPEALAPAGFTPTQLIADLQLSRDNGLANTEALVREWTPRIHLSAATIHHYLTQNIHYTLSPDCILAIELFRAYAAEVDALPPLPALRFL